MFSYKSKQVRSVSQLGPFHGTNEKLGSIRKLNELINDRMNDVRLSEWFAIGLFLLID